MRYEVRFENPDGMKVCGQCTTLLTLPPRHEQ